MLQIKDLTVTHLKDSRAIIENFSFTLNTADKAAVIGEEGDGKSTLLKLIYDQKLIEEYAEYTGEIIKSGLRCSYLEQELPEHLNSSSIYEFCCASPVFSEIAPGELAETARRLYLKPDLFYSDRSFGTLSGGEKVKLRIALILMEKPDVLLLDEPSNDLDTESLQWLEHFIVSCRIPVIFVSHDETLIENAANVIIHFEQEKRKTKPRYTVSRTEYARYVQQRLAEYSRQKQIAKNEKSEYDKQMEKFRKIHDKVELEQASVSRADPHGGRLLKKKMKAVKSMGRRFDREHETITRAPDIEEAISFQFGGNIKIPNGKSVLKLELDELTAGTGILSRNVKLYVTGPEKICITGKNGVGKTTLIRKIAGELLNRNDVKAFYMPQNYAEMLGPDIFPAEFIAGTSEKSMITKARTYLGSVKYTSEEMDHKVSELSGGQKTKLIFLKMIFGEYDVLILDEPTRNLSPLSNPVIRKALKAFGGAVICISHDRKFISGVFDKVLRLTDDGLVKVKGKR